MQLGEHRIKDVSIRIPCSTYAYIEAKIEGIDTLGQAFEIADAMKKNEKQLRYSCEHLMRNTEEGTSKMGKEWKKETCPECGAIRWYNFKANEFDAWQYPIIGGN